MLSLAVLFAALTTGIIPFKYVSSIPAQELDLESILQLAQSNQKNRNAKYTADSQELYNNQYGSLKGYQIEDVLQQTKDSDSNNWQKKKYIYKNAEDGLEELSQSFKNKLATDKLTFGHYQDSNRDFNENALDDAEKQEENLYYKNNDYNLEEDSEKYKYGYFNQKALEQLLSENVLKKKYSENQQKLVPSTLFSPYDLANDKDDDDSASYSKIYVILNPQRVQKSRNRGKLNTLLSKILSLSSSASKGKVDKENRYKGFAIKSRRARRESRETYAGKDSMEEEYKPKRGRSERGSGGAGNGGRTAIPYIRHRGDIYERDN